MTQQKSINAGERHQLGVMMVSLDRPGRFERPVVIEVEQTPPSYQQNHHGHSHDHGHDHSHDFADPAGTEMVPVFAERRRRIPRSCIVGFKVVYGVLYVIVDSNLDAFIFDEMIEYFTGQELHCLLPWAIGFSWNVIPNIPWSIAILAVMGQNDHHDHGHDHGHGHSHEDETTCTKVSHVLGDIGLFLASSTLAIASSMDTINKFHVAVEMSKAVNGTEIGNIWTNCSPLNHTGISEQAPLSYSIPISLLAAAIRGYGDFKLHSTFFHASGGNPLMQFKRTMWDNIWPRNDHGVPWKLMVSFAKLNIIVAHFALGYFIYESIIDVFNLQNYLPEWLSIIIGVAPGIWMAVFEAITETFCIDRILGIPAREGQPEVRPFDVSNILLLTKMSLVISALIHTLPVALEFSTWTHQSPKVIYNVMLFTAYMATFSASSYGFYATTINETYDDIIRGLVCRPRALPAAEEAEAEAERPRPDRRCCGFFRRRADRAPLLDSGAEKPQEPERVERGCGIM